MAKKHTYTKITPLPQNIPRQLALELLHSHEEVIRLNPLVTGVRPIHAPRDASTDEYYSDWYEISQIITWGFGLKSRYSFRGVFHDQPWGLQTHVYAPLGVDLRNKYRIGGNQPGEPREARELGVDTPLDGLYLREDVEITCNLAMMSFVKKETKEATGIMISRLTRKAELLDEGKLHAMFEDGRLKTSRPIASDYALRSPTSASLSPPASPIAAYSHGGSSPAMSQTSFGTPFDAKGYQRYHDIHRKSSLRPDESMPMITELPGSQVVAPSAGIEFRSELPGDQTFHDGEDASTHPPPPHSDDGMPASSVSSYGSSKPATYIPSRVPSQPHPTQRDSLSSPPPPPIKSPRRSPPSPPIVNVVSAGGTSDRPRHDSGIASKPPASYRHSTGSNFHYSRPSPAESPKNTSSRPLSTVFPDHVQQTFAQMNLQPTPLSITETTPPDHLHDEKSSIASHSHLDVPSTSAEQSSIKAPLSAKSSQQSFASAPQHSQQHATDWPLPLRPRSRDTFEEAPRTPTSEEPQTTQSRSDEKATSATANCPVCGAFEGDEAAVSHHAETAHFS